MYAPPAEVLVGSLQRTIAEQAAELALLRATVEFQSNIIESLRSTETEPEDSAAESPDA